MKKNISTRMKQRVFLQAMKKSLGNVTRSCEVAGITRAAYYTWLKKDQKFKEQMDEVEHTKFDFVMSKSFELINGVKVLRNNQEVYVEKPDAQMCKFYLSHSPIGRQLGYGDQLQVGGIKNGEPIKTQAVKRLEEMTDEELQAEYARVKNLEIISDSDEDETDEES